MHAARLRDEHDRHRHVDRRAVEVERIAGGDDQADHRLPAPQILHLAHDARQHRLRRCGAGDDEDVLADVAQQLPDAEAGGARDGAEDDEDEERAREVDGADELREREQAADPVAADGERHAAERADRREPHQHVDDREERLRHLLDQRDQRACARAERQQRQPEEDREQQHLQHLAARERVDDGRRDDVHQEVGGRELLRRGRVGRHLLHVEGRRPHAEAAPGLERRDDDEADHEHERRHHLEVHERAQTDATHLLHVPHLRDADDDRGEHDRRDHHLDQLDERVAERAHGGGALGREIPEQRGRRDRDEDLNEQAPVQRPCAHCSGCFRTDVGRGFQPRLGGPERAALHQS